LKQDCAGASRYWDAGFPRRFAAASLKHQLRAFCDGAVHLFSAAIRRGLIEASWLMLSLLVCDMFSAAIRRGLIEARM